MEVVALVNLDRTQVFLENLLSKLLGGHKGQVAAEWKKQNRVNSGCFQKLQFLSARSK